MPDKAFSLRTGKELDNFVLHIDNSAFADLSKFDEIPGALIVNKALENPKGRTIFFILLDPLYEKPIDEIYNYVKGMVNEEAE